MLPFAPLSQVAPRCLAAVQHGGIGTTVAVLTAGLPQLIVPRGFDQPQTALRMSGRGVAMTIPWARASSSTLQRGLDLQQGLDRLLSTEDYRKRAAAIATSLQRERGLDQAMTAIEQLVT